MVDKRLLIVGATGMVGGCALRICLDTPDVSEVTVIGRRPTGIQHSKLREIRHADFTDFAGVGDRLAGHDAALYCLGVYTGAVPDDAFRRITLDFTTAFAGAFRQHSPRASFCFLSGQGADQSERSRLAFARYKGAAEKALIDLAFADLVIFRPGYIYPVTPREEPNFSYRVTRVLWPVLRRIWPNLGLASEDLALAMVHAGLYGKGDPSGPVLENRDIRMLAAASRLSTRSCSSASSPPIGSE
jgi:nucleoside-diphosphate-sugar epimerase